MSSLTNLFTSLLLLSIFIPECCHAHSKPETEHKTLFVFGDSLFDLGNNQYLNTNRREQSSFRPYGETFFRHPTGRYSDGRIVPDFIAQFANLPILPPYLQPGTHNFTDGTNFASAGSGVLPSTDSPFINLPTQLIYFNDVVKTLNKQLGEAEAKRVLNNAVYLFSSGGNDYIRLYTENPNVTHSEIVGFPKTVISNLNNSLKEVYNLGGRKFAFQNLAPLGCLPRYRLVGDACAEDLLALARGHNVALSQLLNKLESNLPGFRYSLFDYYNALGDRINNPFKYGFEEGKAACCGIGPYRSQYCGGKNGRGPYELCSNPYKYVWFDGLHSTEGANHQLAKLIWSGTPNVTAPYTVEQLFGYYYK